MTAVVRVLSFPSVRDQAPLLDYTEYLASLAIASGVLLYVKRSLLPACVCVWQSHHLSSRGTFIVGGLRACTCTCSFEILPSRNYIKYILYKSIWSAFLSIHVLCEGVSYFKKILLIYANYGGSTSYTDASTSRIYVVIIAQVPGTRWILGLHTHIYLQCHSVMQSGNVCTWSAVLSLHVLSLLEVTQPLIGLAVVGGSVHRLIACILHASVVGSHMYRRMCTCLYNILNILLLIHNSSSSILTYSQHNAMMRVIKWVILVFMA